MDVLSFDCGLRNLAAVVVSQKPGFAFPPEYRCFATDEETADDFKARALAYFVSYGWTVRDADLIDVSEHLGRDTRVKSVKKLGLMSKAEAIHAALDSLEQKWFAETAPDVVAVEIQHGANAEMRAVSLAIPVFFRRSMDAAEFIGVVGGHKLKVCDVLGVAEGDGLKHLLQLREDKKTAKAALRKTPKKAAKAKGPTATFLKFLVKEEEEEVEDVELEDEDDGPTLDDRPVKKAWYNPRGKMWTKKKTATAGTTGLSLRDKYEDNKGRSMKAMEVMRGSLVFKDDTLSELIRDPNVADAILQAVWVLWTKLAPRTPIRKKRKKVDA
jgi:hypothetical protein